MKKFLTCTLALTLSLFTLLGSVVPASAQEKITAEGPHYIDIESAILNPEEYPDIEIIVHETVDDYIEAVENDNNLTLETKARLINDAKDTLETRSTNSYGYITARDTAVITSSYEVRPYFYCKVLYDGSPTPSELVSIENSNIDRNYNGVSKQFTGQLYVNLESYKIIYWDLNGDFYDNGTTTYSAHGSISVGGSGTVGFSISSASDHYAYKHASSRLVFPF